MKKDDLKEIEYKNILLKVNEYIEINKYTCIVDNLEEEFDYCIEKYHKENWIKMSSKNSTNIDEIDEVYENIDVLYYSLSNLREKIENELKTMLLSILNSDSNEIKYELIEDIDNYNIEQINVALTRFFEEFSSFDYNANDFYENFINFIENFKNYLTSNGNS